MINLFLRYRISNTPSSGSEPLNSQLAAVNSKSTAGQGDAPPKYKGCVKTFFLIINLGLMVMMSATGTTYVCGHVCIYVYMSS
jgi:hypothetical protein